MTLLEGIDIRVYVQYLKLQRSIYIAFIGSYLSLLPVYDHLNVNTTVTILYRLHIIRNLPDHVAFL